MSNNRAARQLDFAFAGAVIDALGTGRSYPMMFDLIASNLPFEMASVIVYRGRSRPVLIFDSFEHTPYREGLTNFVGFSYVLSPCYQAYLDGIKPGVYRMSELVPDEYPLTQSFKSAPAVTSRKEEIGYLTQGWPEEREELFLLVGLPEGAMAEVSFLRPRSDAGFNDDELARLAAMAPFVASVVRANWQRVSIETRPPRDNAINRAFDAFGKHLLSERECEVVRLILQGHSSISISLRLEISITTVKSHRKNAYAKLNISTQSELMAMFLQSLDEAVPVSR
jgi:DNA-binding CsgD family transcriptional regulator